MTRTEGNVETCPRGKVSRLIDEHELDGLGDELVARWTAETDRMSLRDLATYFNEEHLRSTLEGRGVDVLPGEMRNLYRILTDDDVTSGTRTQAENRLANHDIDVDGLRADFVSRQAISTYLDGRGVTYERDDDESDVVDRRFENLQRLASRQSAVVERTLSSLSDSGHLSLGEFQVLLSVQVQCTDCDRLLKLTEVLDRRGCECSDPAVEISDEPAVHD